MAEAKEFVCGYCGVVGKSRTVTPGSVLIELVLWCFMIVPGLIYSLWRVTSRRKVCATCGSAMLVPSDSPAGKALIAQHKTR